MAKGTVDNKIHITKRIELSREIHKIPVKKIKVNPINRYYFRMLSDTELSDLKEDMNKRGLQNPLILKKDNMLLCGENRLLCAEMLGWETIDVRYVITKLTAEEETEYIINDNARRRQLTKQHIIEICEKFYKAFHKRILLEGRGRGSKMSMAINADTVLRDFPNLPKGLTRTAINQHRNILKMRNAREMQTDHERAISAFKLNVSRNINKILMELPDTRQRKEAYAVLMERSQYMAKKIERKPKKAS